MLGRRQMQDHAKRAPLRWNARGSQLLFAQAFDNSQCVLAMSVKCIKRTTTSPLMFQPYRRAIARQVPSLKSQLVASRVSRW